MSSCEHSKDSSKWSWFVWNKLHRSGQKVLERLLVLGLKGNLTTRPVGALNPGLCRLRLQLEQGGVKLPSSAAFGSFSVTIRAPPSSSKTPTWGKRTAPDQLQFLMETSPHHSVAESWMSKWLFPFFTMIKTSQSDLSNRPWMHLLYFYTNHTCTCDQVNKSFLSYWCED